MQRAIDEAYKGVNAGDGGPFGAVIVKDGEVLVSCHNTVLKDNDATHHAEINAITAVSALMGTFDLSGCEIYSTTESCPMCFSAIHWARIDRLIYGTSIPDVQKLGFNELMLPVAKIKEMAKLNMEIKSGFMLEECLELLEYWNNGENKKIY